MIQQFQQGGLGPLHVVQNGHERMAVGQTFEECPDRPERLLGNRAALRERAKKLVPADPLNSKTRLGSLSKVSRVYSMDG